MSPLLLLLAAFINHVLAGSIDVKLLANWTDSPFEVQLVEALAAYNDTFYLPTVKTLFMASGEESDWDDNEDESSDFAEVYDVDSPFIGDLGSGLDLLATSDQARYETVSSRLTTIQKGFLDLYLVNSMYSPRIQAHYDHYFQEIKPEFEAEVSKQCATDSFGEPIENPLGAWVKYTNKVYCSEQDLYALQLDKTSEEVLSFDRPIGVNRESPRLVLYGDPTTQRFPGMFLTLSLLAQAGNLQFMWRYIPYERAPKLELSGYGKTLTVRKKKEIAPRKTNKFSSLKEFLDIYTNSDVFDVPKNHISRVSTMLTSLVLGSSPSDRFEHLCTLLKKLPMYAAHLVNAQTPSNFESVAENAQANEKKGASRDLVGLSVNGAMVNRLETDMPYVMNKFQTEIRLIEEMERLGFTKPQAKKLFTKFALLSAYKENEYRTGSSQNRYTLFRDIFNPKDESSGGVVFFNDLSRDENYNLYSADRYKVYIEEAGKFRQGQIPPLKENVHDIIFAINLSNKSQLKVFFAMSKMILDKGIPQQLGLLPLVQDEKDARIANLLYRILEVGQLQEALAFLYKYLEAQEEDEENLFSLVTLPEDLEYRNYVKTLEKYSISEPSVIINGVIVDMRSSNWQTQMGQQILHDVQILQNAIRQRKDYGQELKDILYSSAKSFRNLRVTPKDPGNIRYKKVTTELIDASVAFKKVVDPSFTSITFWLIGDFSSSIVLDQLKQIFIFMRRYNGRSSQVRIINTTKDSKILDKLAAQYSSKLLTSASLRDMAEFIGDVRVQTISERDPAKLKLLERGHIQLHQNTLLFNSRQIRLDSVLHVDELQHLLLYEFPQRLDIIDEVLAAYPADFEHQTITDFKPETHDDLDWYDRVTSVITESFNLDDSLVRTDVARFDLSSLNYENSIDITGYDEDKPLDVIVTIDPVDEFSQKLVAMVEALRDLPFVNILLLLQPLSLNEEPTALNRFYASGFSRLKPFFTSDGAFRRWETESFDGISSSTYRADVDVPNRWVVVKSTTSGDVDTEDFSFGKGDITACFLLQQLAVEAFVKNVKTGAAVPGLSIRALRKDSDFEGFTMETMGYNQVRLGPGVWQYGLTTGVADGIAYEMLSADANAYVANDQAMVSVPLNVFSLSGNPIHVRVREINAGADVLAKPDVNMADINVFSIASGLTYEKLMAIMMLSVKTHTKNSVKFWILEEFLSGQFKAQLPILAAAHQFQYQLISYKWPIWLRQQSEAHRTVWAYKMLFLDVLFPQDLKRVVFVDADQVARTDLTELMSLDLQGAPYGFAPMCESREDMEGFRFWKQGYWETVLKDDLKYHISALFVVDLVVFRENTVGDKLRSHYQKLSSDPDSLANLDQDLPNNLQRQVPIFSLPQEWLWCETWCSEALKKAAKMIDLCNDPTSDETKLARAKRLIPEWTSYNKMLQKIGDGKLELLHDEL